MSKDTTKTDASGMNKFFDNSSIFSAGKTEPKAEREKELESEITELKAQLQSIQNKEQAEAERKASLKDKPVYFKLDISGYDDYLKVMTDLERKNSKCSFSVTKYIRRLLKADMDANIEAYRKGKKKTTK